MQVDQQATHIDEILVEVVEIGEQDVAPVDELVKRLRTGLGAAGHQFDVLLVKDVQQARLLLGFLDTGDLGEEFVDGQHVGHEHRPPGRLTQIAFEEGGGPPVREYETHPVQRSPLRESLRYCL